MRGARKGPALFAVAVLLSFAGVSDADVAVEAKDRNVAIVAEDASLRRVLEALADAQIIDVSASLPLDARVTLATDMEPLPRLLRRLLRPYSYTLIEHDAASHRLPRLHVFSDSDPGAPASWVALPSAAPGLLDQAIADLASPDEDVRVEAVLRLSDSGNPDVAAHFLATLGDPSPGVREAARAALEDMESVVPDGRHRQSATESAD